MDADLQEILKVNRLYFNVKSHINITKLTIWFLHGGLSLLAGFSDFFPCVNNIKKAIHITSPFERKANLPNSHTCREAFVL